MPRLPAKQLVTAAPVSIGTANTEGSGNAVARSDHVHSHGNQAGGALHSAATTSANGFMSAYDKSRVNGVFLGEKFTCYSVSPTNIDLSDTATPITLIDGAYFAPGSNANVLLPNQTNAAQRGVWRLQTDASSLPTWTRQGNFDDHVVGFLVLVASGNTYSNSLWSVRGVGGSGFVLETSTIQTVNLGRFPSSAQLTKLDGIASGATNTPLSSSTPETIGTPAAGSSGNVSRSDHVHGHGSQTDPTHHAIAVPNGDAGFMSGAQALKLLYVPYLAGSDVSTVGVANSPGTSSTHCAPFDHVHAHGDHNTPSMHAVATAVANGFMPAADKSKLDGMGPYTLSPAALGAAAQGASALFARGDHVHPHGDQGGGSLHALVTQSVAGFMDPVDKTRLDFFSEDAVVQNGSVGWVRPAIRMPISGTPTAMTNNTVFCIYMGYTLKAMTITVVRWYMPTAGVGTDNGCQVGIGYSVAAPNLAGLATVTPKALSAVSSPLATGNKTNSTLFNLAVPAGTHLWGLVKSALATTQMSSYPIVGDVTGSVQSKGSAGTLVVDTNIVCTAYAASAPDLTLQAA